MSLATPLEYSVSMVNPIHFQMQYLVGIFNALIVHHFSDATDVTGILLFYVEFLNNQRKFFAANEMRLKWPWVVVDFLEPQLRPINAELCNQLCKYFPFNYIINVCCIHLIKHHVTFFVCILRKKTAIVTRRQHRQMRRAGFDSAFEIIIIRNISLEMFLIADKPSKVVTRRQTIDTNVKVGEPAMDMSGMPTSDPTGTSNAAAPQLVADSGESSVIDQINNDNMGAGGPEANIAGISVARSKSAVEKWQKWSAQPLKVPFGVRGRRRNSMLADFKFTLPTIDEGNDGIGDV